MGAARARSGVRKTASASRAVYPSINRLRTLPATARDESFVRSQGLGSGQAGMQMQVPLRVRPEPTGDVRERRPHARRKHDLPPLPPGSVSFGFIYFTQIEVF